VTTSWWAAVTVLTRLPARSGSSGQLGIRWFGVVGAMVGAAGAVPLIVLGAALPMAAASLALAAMAILSGALHLDGLADTADALVAIGPGAPERARKDPSIGVAGATALVLVLGIEIFSLAALVGGSGAVVAALTCLVAGASSRAVPVIVGWASRSHATGSGLGATFAGQVTIADGALAMVTALGVALMAAVAADRATLLIGGVLGVAAGLALGLAIVRLRRQLDGDGLGATVELSFAATVLLTAAFGRWPAA
jgi:adenosylcobinamide-GDP ribazoletransferase